MLQKLSKTELLRANLTSDVWHTANKHAARYLFGINNTWQQIKKRLEIVFDVKCETEEVGSPLTNFEEMLTVCMREQHNFGDKTICFIVEKKQKCCEQIHGKMATLFREAR